VGRGISGLFYCRLAVKAVQRRTRDLKKACLVLIIVFLLLASLAACSNKQNTKEPDNDGQVQNGANDKIIITGPDIGEKDITVSEIRELPTVNKDVVVVDSAGKESHFNVTGSLFADILAAIGKKTAGLKLGAVRCGGRLYD
jgi:hypothetical protein